MNEPEVPPDMRVGHVPCASPISLADRFYATCWASTSRLRPRFGLRARCSSPRELPPPHRPEHLAEPGWNTTPRGAHWTLSSRPPLPRPPWPRPRRAATPEPRLPHQRRRDHGATVSVYLSDPDGNGIELYYDGPRSEWFDPQGNPVLKRTRSTRASYWNSITTGGFTPLISVKPRR